MFHSLGEECVGFEWPKMPWESIYGDISIDFLNKTYVRPLSKKENLQIFQRIFQKDVLVQSASLFSCFLLTLLSIESAGVFAE